MCVFSRSRRYQSRLFLRTRVLEVCHDAEGLQLLGKSCSHVWSFEQRVRVHAHGVVRSGGLFYQPHCFHDVPGTRLELVIGKSKLGSDLSLGGGLFRFHRAGPVGDRNPVPDLLPEESVDGNLVCLSGNIQEGTGNCIWLAEGIECQRILPRELGRFSAN